MWLYRRVLRKQWGLQEVKDHSVKQWGHEITFVVQINRRGAVEKWSLYVENIENNRWGGWGYRKMFKKNWWLFHFLYDGNSLACTVTKRNNEIINQLRFGEMWIGEPSQLLLYDYFVSSCGCIAHILSFLHHTERCVWKSWTAG